MFVFFANLKKKIKFLPGFKSDTTSVKQLETSGLLGEKFNFVNPPTKDTLALPNGGYAFVRFLAKNPGYFLFDFFYLKLYFY